MRRKKKLPGKQMKKMPMWQFEPKGATIGIRRIKRSRIGKTY